MQGVSTVDFFPAFYHPIARTSHIKVIRDHVEVPSSCTAKDMDRKATCFACFYVEAYEHGGNTAREMVGAPMGNQTQDLFAMRRQCRAMTTLSAIHFTSVCLLPVLKIN